MATSQVGNSPASTSTATATNDKYLNAKDIKNLQNYRWSAKTMLVSLDNRIQSFRAKLISMRQDPQKSHHLDMMYLKADRCIVRIRNYDKQIQDAQQRSKHKSTPRSKRSL